MATSKTNSQVQCTNSCNDPSNSSMNLDNMVQCDTDSCECEGTAQHTTTTPGQLLNDLSVMIQGGKILDKNVKQCSENLANDITEEELIRRFKSLKYSNNDFLNSNYNIDLLNNDFNFDLQNTDFSDKEVENDSFEVF